MAVFEIIDRFMAAGLDAQSAIIAAKVHCGVAAETAPVEAHIPADLMPPALAQAVREAAARHGVTVEAVMGHGRGHPVSRARREGYLAARNLGMSYPQIAQAFNRDHTTVIHGVKGLRDKMKRDAK